MRDSAFRAQMLGPMSTGTVKGASVQTVRGSHQVGLLTQILGPLFHGKAQRMLEIVTAGAVQCSSHKSQHGDHSLMLKVISASAGMKAMSEYVHTHGKGL